MTYSDTYRLLFSSGIDHLIFVYNPYFDTLMGQLNGHTSPICSLAVVDASAQLISADLDGVIKIWDM